MDAHDVGWATSRSTHSRQSELGLPKLFFCSRLENILKSQSELQSNRLHRVCYDMDETVGYLEALSAVIAVPKDAQPAYQAQIMQALLAAAIVAYARGFKNSRSDGNASPSVQFAEIFESPEQWSINLHQTLIAKRDQAVAHADWSQHSTRLVYVTPKGDVQRAGTMPDIWSGIRIETFERLVNAVKGAALEKALALDRSGWLTRS